MKHILLYFIISSGLITCVKSQTIDSVIVRNCREYYPVEHFSIVDSFSSGLHINQTTQYTSGAITSREYTYSGSGKILSETVRNFQPSFGWSIIITVNYQYDLNDSLILKQSLNYSMSTGLPTSGLSYVYSYTITPPTKSTLLQTYNTTGSWEDMNLNTEYFDSLGRRIQLIRETSIAGTLMWYSTTTYNYDLNNQLNFSQTILNNQPDTVVFLWNYNLNMQLTMELEYEKNIVLTPVSKINYHYDTSQNQIGTATFENISGTWLQCDTSNFTFDAQNRITTFFSNAMGICGNSGNNGWNVYNAAGNFDSTNYCHWSSMSGPYCTTCSYQYMTLVSVSEKTTPVITFFPNPVSEKLVLTNPELYGKKVILCDISGRRVLCMLIDQSLTIPMKQCSTGIYFLGIEDQSYPMVKVIKN